MLSENNPSLFNDTSRMGNQRDVLMSCTDGSDGYPTLFDFNMQMERYLDSKKRSERTVISAGDLDYIQMLLSDPASLRAAPSASYRAWIKKTFFLRTTPSGIYVCHKEKGDAGGRPVASKEAMYYILKEAHASDGHGGRDKTAKAVKLTHSFIRKSLICIFLENCPTCLARKEAVKKEKLSLLKTSGDKSFIYNNAPHSATSFGTGFTSPDSPNLDFGLSYSQFNEKLPKHRGSLPTDIYVPSHLAIKRPVVPLELARVPAAPVIRNRGSSVTSVISNYGISEELSSAENLSDPFSYTTVPSYAPVYSNEHQALEQSYRVEPFSAPGNLGFYNFNHLPKSHSLMRTTLPSENSNLVFEPNLESFSFDTLSLPNAGSDNATFLQNNLFPSEDYISKLLNEIQEPHYNTDEDMNRQFSQNNLCSMGNVSNYCSNLSLVSPQGDFPSQF
ncbi:hypothetical protein BY996DRAFT_4629540 [Phakopsora pachyrhizi]|nr:hypothetical protein BY996DRAFT_4629540 [Phakopsora pachyrhizi]